MARLVSKLDTLSALDNALSAGVLTKDEYAAKKAALLAPVAPIPPAPVETVSKVPEPQPPREAKNVPAPSTPLTLTRFEAHTYRMKMIKVVDQSGFERPITSVSMLIPTDWESQGATTWNIKDRCNTIQTTVHATGPDGRGVDIFPAYNWTWADDPKFLQQTYAQSAQMGTHACDVIPPMGAADYLRRNLGKIRPNAQVVGFEPTPKLMQILQQQARQAEQSAAQYRLQQRVRPDVVRARVKYSLNGRPVEE